MDIIIIIIIFIFIFIEIYLVIEDRSGPCKFSLPVVLEYLCTRYRLAFSCHTIRTVVSYILYHPLRRMPYTNNNNNYHS